MFIFFMRAFYIYAHKLMKYVNNSPHFQKFSLPIEKHLQSSKSGGNAYGMLEECLRKTFKLKLRIRQIFLHTKVFLNNFVALLLQQVILDQMNVMV